MLKKLNQVCNVRMHAKFTHAKKRIESTSCLFFLFLFEQGTTTRIMKSRQLLSDTSYPCNITRWQFDFHSVFCLCTFLHQDEDLGSFLSTLLKKGLPSGLWLQNSTHPQTINTWPQVHIKIPIYIKAKNTSSSMCSLDIHEAIQLYLEGLFH